MSLILETKNINKFFGKAKSFHVLTDICMGIEKGEFTSNYNIRFPGKTRK